MASACSGRAAKEARPPVDAAVDAAVPTDAAVVLSQTSFALGDNLHLLGISDDGTTAILGDPQPLRAAPVFLPFDLDAMRSRQSVVLTVLGGVPRPPRLSANRDFRPMLAALASSRWLDGELAELGALLRDVPRASMPYWNVFGFAASADGTVVAYTADGRFGLHVRLPDRPAAFHVPEGDDPWIAPDGSALLYITSDPFADTVALWVQSLVDDPPAKPRRVENAGRVLFHLPRVALPEGKVRVITTRASRVCLVDVSLVEARTTRWACEPDACKVCDPGAYALSADGAWFAWTRYVDRWGKGPRRIRLRVMEVATNQVRFDVTSREIDAGGKETLSIGAGGRTFVGLPDHGIDIDPATQTMQRIPLAFAPRTCLFRDATRIACLTTEHRMTTVDLATATGTVVP